MKVIIFGTGTSSDLIYEEVSKENEVIGFTDGIYTERWGTMKSGIPIYSPEECLLKMDYDAVIIGAFTGPRVIYQQCLDMGIPANKIISSYADQSGKSRAIFLKHLCKELNGYEQEAKVAEAGVFQGEFAKLINEYFPNRVLHLFDTFEGYDAKDIALEKAQRFSNAEAGLFRGTSVELVMSKMPFPDMCQVHKGYFPDTAKGVEGPFCFVSIDLDLYTPVYSGLKFFGERMTNNGVILVNSYYVAAYKGIKEAVNTYLAECKGSIQKYPIGDGLSIMLVGKWN